MTNNIEVHRASSSSEPCAITIGTPMEVGVAMSGQSDRAVAIGILAERDAKAITNALVDNLPFMTLALVRERLNHMDKS